MSKPEEHPEKERTVGREMRALKVSAHSSGTIWIEQPSFPDEMVVVEVHPSQVDLLCKWLCEVRDEVSPGPGQKTRKTIEEIAEEIGRGVFADPVVHARWRAFVRQLASRMELDEAPLRTDPT